MSGFNWQAAGISFGVCFAGGMIVTYSLTLPGRKQWYFTPPTQYPVKPDRSSMFTGELARANVSPGLPTSSSYDYSARLPNTPSGAPVFSSPAPSAAAYDENPTPVGGKTRRKHKGKKRSHKKSRR